MAVRVVVGDLVLGVLVAEQAVADLDDDPALVLRDAEDLGEDLHRDLRGDLAHEVELALGQGDVQHLPRDLADLLLPDVHRARREAPVDQPAQLVVARRVHVDHRLARLDVLGLEVLQRRAADLGGEELDVAVDVADVLVAGHRPEARPPSGSGFQWTGSSRRSCGERLVRDRRRRTRRGRRGRCGSGSGSHGDCLALEVVQVLGDLPVGDPGAVALDLEALDRQEGRRRSRRRARRAGPRRPRARRARPRASSGRRVAARARGRRGRRRRRPARGGASSRRMPSAPAASDRGDRQVRVGRAVADAELDPGRAAALGRDAHERGAVVPAPVGVGRRQRVRLDPPVGVDGRVEDRHQRRRVLEHAADEPARLVADAVGVVGRRRRRWRRRGSATGAGACPSRPGR